MSYKELMLREIQTIPESKMMRIYAIMHPLLSALKVTRKRGSLKGIWKDVKVEDSLLEDAKKSLFSYEDEK